MEIEQDNKKDVFEFHANGIYYDNGYNLIYDASKGCFNKEPQDMTEYDCTLFVGIPNSHQYIHLMSDMTLKNRGQNKVTKYMVDAEDITEQDAKKIIGER